MTGIVHEDEYPFEESEDQWDDARRLRSRLVAPVAVVTAGGADRRAGLTVSSVVVSDGPPCRVHLLTTPEAEVVELLGRTGRFVVHVLRADQWRIADIFAGRRPTPGGPFSTLTVEDTPWGPVLEEVSDRAFCSYVASAEHGAERLVTGDIDRLVTSELTTPLAFFRERYRTLGGPPVGTSGR